jgi:hypothetical protein
MTEEKGGRSLRDFSYKLILRAFLSSFGLHLELIMLQSAVPLSDDSFDLLAQICVFSSELPLCEV